MELSGLDLANGAATSNTVGDIVSTVECPVVGKHKTKRVTSTCKSSIDGKTISVLVEEYKDTVLLARQIDQYVPVRTSTKELFENDGAFVCSETERTDKFNRVTKIVIRGAGKSSTTRVMCADVEARATERSILIESPKASYTYMPFEGRWSTFYKEIGMKLELKACYLKNPDTTLEGPDGLKLQFKNGRLIDMILPEQFVVNEADANRMLQPLL